MSFIRKMKKVLSSKKYRENPNPENLSQERLAALNIGAINSEQTCYYCDSLTTGEKVYEIKGNLENFYDITDHDSAVETLEWLFNRGHRIYFDAIKTMYSGTGEGIDYSKFTEEKQANFMEYFMNMQGVLPFLVEAGYFSGNVFDIAKMSIIAWDMGRLVMVTRSCYDCGYISEEEAWKYIENAYKACKEVYADWNEFAKGYVFGRAMWSGDAQFLAGIMSIAEGLLADEQSPWKKVCLK